MPTTRTRYIADFIVSSNDIANGAITASDLGTIYTDNITEATNLFFTNARVYSNVSPLLTTANVTEVTNLYFTNARVYSNVISLLPNYTGTIAVSTFRSLTANAEIVFSTDTDVRIANTQIASSNTSGALVVSGGVGVAGNLHANALYASAYYFANGSPLVTGGGGGTTITNESNVNSSTFYVVLANNITSGSLTAANVSSSKLYFNPNTGTLNATVFNSLSDENQKEKVVQILNATGFVKQINGYEFEWLGSGKKSAGVLAQKIENILPHLVDTNNGIKSVNYSGIIAYLIETVKELDNRISLLEKNK